MEILIVDDEKRARNVVHQMLNMYGDGNYTIKEADSVELAAECISQAIPDLIFLDIKLGDRNGFDLLKLFHQTPLNVIFITAYNEFAIRALKVSAIDYLLKPIDPEEFLEALQKAKNKIRESQWNKQMELFFHNFNPNQQTKQVEKIILKTLEAIHLVHIEDIVYCESNRNYTTFYLSDSRKITTSKPMKEYEGLLPKELFIRPHQSYLVNIEHIIRYEKGDLNHLITAQDYHIPVAIRRKDYIIGVLEGK